MQEVRTHNLTGWAFLLPATLLIGWMSFYPMIRAFILSLQTGMGVNLSFNGFANYARILKDPTFKQTLFNTFFNLIVQVPIMLVLRSLGMSPIMWFGNAWTARAVIIIALVWRWTGYNMVFYLSGLQNIEYSVYEAAKIDGASPMQSFFKITVPLLKPTILLTAITSTNGTLQLFDESLNLTNGGPGKSTMTMSHYIYNISFKQSPNFGYAAAMSILILIMVAILAILQMKVGDER